MSTAIETRKAVIHVHDPKHRLTEEQINFALDLYNSQVDDTGCRTASVIITHVFGEGAICELHHHNNLNDFGWCKLTLSGHVDGGWH